MRGLITVSLVVLGTFTASGQTFEVASIKANVSGQEGIHTHMPDSKGGELVIENAPLSMILEMAFDVKDYALNAPDWTNSLRFDVVAKVPPKTTRKQGLAMMQALLAERFGL